MQNSVTTRYEMLLCHALPPDMKCFFAMRLEGARTYQEGKYANSTWYWIPSKINGLLAEPGLNGLEEKKKKR
jgi:hypothetical protein